MSPPEPPRPQASNSQPAATRELASAEKPTDGEDMFSKAADSQTDAAPAKGEQVFAKDFEEGEDWFVATGAPVAREAEPQPEISFPEPVSTKSATPWILVLGMLGAAAGILFVGIIIVLLIT